MRRTILPLIAAILFPLIASAAVCPNLTRNLSRGASGDDVRQLQQFLIDQHDLESGFDTGYFGSLTEAAVKKFQCEQNLVCDGSSATTGWGSVGPRTRAAIVAVCGRAAGTTPPPPPVTGTNAGGSCYFGGKTILNRGAVTAYKSQTVPFLSSCESEQRVCHDGTLTGTYQYAFCVRNLASSCSLDGATVYDGQFQTFYSASSVQSPDSCSQHAELRECVNGFLAGSSEYQYATCSDDTHTNAGVIAAPTGLSARCDASGTQVTLTWSPSSGAASYGIRVVPTGTSTFTVLSDWYRATSLTANISPNRDYSWWVHANPDTSQLGAYTVGPTFRCAGNDFGNQNPRQSISVDGRNIYSPAPVLFANQPRLYFGGWMNESQTHDNIYVADCPFAAGTCSNIRTGIDSASQGFEHVNDPTIVLHPAVGESPAYYIMYMTGVPAGESGLTLSSNKIYYSTSWGTDGISWSRPVLLTSGFWLPSATMKDGHVILFANSTSDGRIAKFDLGESGISVGTPEYVTTFDNPTSIPPFYSNVDVVWRPSLNLYQIVAERALSTTPGAASVIDYLTSADGTSWHLAKSSVISADTGQFRVGTPAQWVDSAQWIYFGSTAQRDSMGFKIRFAQWNTAP